MAGLPARRVIVASGRRSTTLVDGLPVSAVITAAEQTSACVEETPRESVSISVPRTASELRALKKDDLLRLAHSKNIDVPEGSKKSEICRLLELGLGLSPGAGHADKRPVAKTDLVKPRRRRSGR